MEDNGRASCRRAGRSGWSVTAIGCRQCWWSATRRSVEGPPDYSRVELVYLLWNLGRQNEDARAMDATACRR